MPFMSHPLGGSHEKNDLDIHCGFGVLHNLLAGRICHGSRNHNRPGLEATTLDPQLREDGGERAVNDNIYETLMARKPDGKLVPGLAASEPRLIDPLTWEIKLRPGVKFHNGEPFNADAVVFSIKRIIDPKFNSEQMSFFNTIKGAEKVDDLTVKVFTTGPDPILLSRLYWMKMVPPVHSKDAKFMETPDRNRPLQICQMEPRSEPSSLKPPTAYWGEEPEIKKVTYRFVSDPGTRWPV